jgi:competence protein ComEA
MRIPDLSGRPLSFVCERAKETPPEALPTLVRWLSAAILGMALSAGAVGQLAQTNATQQSATKAKPAPAARLDINRASVEELTKIPGITQTWAARIVRFRPYRTKADLLDRGVLPSGVYDRIKDYVIAHR